MIFKNSVKILFSNFNIVWKTVLYYLLLFLIFATAIFFCLKPIYEMIESAGFVGSFVDLYTNFVTTLNLYGFFESLNVLFDNIFGFITNNLSNIWFYILGAGIITFFVGIVISNLTIYASCISLNYYMGSLAKQNFYVSYKDTIGKNFKFQLAYYLVSLPLKLLMVLGFVFVLKLFNYATWWVSLLAVFIIVLIFVLLIALKFSLFCAWAPMMVIMNYGVWKALRMGIKASFRKFGKVFACAIGLVLLLLFLNLFFGMFTFMVGALIIIPMSYLWYSSFGMVVAYESQGMRYYVDICNVVSPQKKEISDKLNDMRYII